MIYRTVTIQAEITDSIVAVSPVISGNISTEAELTTTLRIGEYDDYEGSYHVIPLADADQTLETRDKHMTDDVTISKVPFYETTNEYGTTVYIAEV